MSDPTDLRIQSHKTGPTYFRCQLQVVDPQVTHITYVFDYKFDYELEVPMTTSSGFINLLEQLTELKETVTLPVY